jgi:hypothetical protein
MQDVGQLFHIGESASALRRCHSLCWRGCGSRLVWPILLIRPQSAASTVQFTLRERLTVSLLFPMYDCKVLGIFVDLSRIGDPGSVKVSFRPHTQFSYQAG